MQPAWKRIEPYGAGDIANRNENTVAMNKNNRNFADET